MMFYRIKNAQPRNNFMLEIEFLDGTVKLYDVKQLFCKFPIFKVLQTNPELFRKVRVDIGGYGISWNDELDLSCNELYYVANKQEKL